MPEPKIYATATDFRRALEDRLNQTAKNQSPDLARLRKMVAFERLLARLFCDERPPWLLKGGYAMEMRFRENARATKDIDLALPEAHIAPGGDKITSDQLLTKLGRAAAIDLKDWFNFQVGDFSAALDAQPYGGFRFPVESKVDDRVFTNFHFDVALGDPADQEPEWITGHDLLAFAGIPAVKIAVISKEQHFAEKIHAYTRPRAGAINSRTRDLLDLALLIRKGELKAGRAVAAIQATFKRRKTHAIPADLNFPPNQWEKPYQRMAEETGFPITQMPEAFQLIVDYWKSIQPLIAKE